MEVLNGLYRIKKPHQIEENHGGGTLKDEIFWFLSFYENSDFVGLYGSSQNDFRFFFSREFELKGKIIERGENSFKLFIFNPYSNERIIFNGAVMNNGNELSLKAFNESTPEKIWLDDLFERVAI